MTSSSKCPFDWFFFNFGGVIAEEGFVNGMRALARAEAIDTDFMGKTGIQSEGNIQRAQDQGITTIFYQSREAFLDRLKTLCPLDGLLE